MPPWNSVQFMVMHDLRKLWGVSIQWVCFLFFQKSDMTMWWSKHFFHKISNKNWIGPVRAMRYSGLGVRSVGPVGDFLETCPNNFLHTWFCWNFPRKATLRREVLKGSYQACRVGLGTWMWGESLHPAKWTARLPQNHRNFKKACHLPPIFILGKASWI